MQIGKVNISGSLVYHICITIVKHEDQFAFFYGLIRCHQNLAILQAVLFTNFFIILLAGSNLYLS